MQGAVMTKQATNRYAIIATGGKQYRVAEGDSIEVELISMSEDGKITFDQVLCIGSGTSLRVGAPFVDQATVQGQWIQEVKGPKEIAYKYKKRKNYQRKVGHRQRYAQVRITEIIG
jgi:large subunit ribosomal protein L21